MATLTQVSVTARKTIRYTIYGVILLIIGRMVLGIGIGVFNKVFPKKAPPPTVAFSKLPKLPFPNTDKPQNLTYVVQTPSGELPKLETQAKVYIMPKLSASLLSLTQTKTKASSLGYSTLGNQTNQTIYEFKSPQAPATLTINIANQTFSVSYDLGQDPSPLTKLPPPPDTAASAVKSFLSSGQTLPEDLTGPVTHSFLKVQGKSLVNAISLSEANFVKINLFRKDFDKIPSLTANPTEGNVWFLVTGDTSRDKRIIGGEFHYFPVNEEQSSTYPLKTAQTAVEELKGGKAYIANLGENLGGQITVRKVYLAYFDPKTQSDFYAPIIVFEGDKNFFAYVPAITSEYQEQ